MGVFMVLFKYFSLLVLIAIFPTIGMETNAKRPHSDELSLKQRALYAQDFKDLAIEYRDHLTYEDEDCKVYDTDALRRTPDSYRSCLNKNIRPPLYLKYINNEVGYGVFAETNLYEDDFIQEYAGHVISAEQLFYNGRNLNNSYLMTLFPSMSCHLQTPDMMIDAKKAGNFTRFINHSEKPNVKIKLVLDAEGLWHVVFFMGRTTHADEQLFIDYGRKYWEFLQKSPQDLTRNNL
jgi:hypothetical protein